MHYNKVVGSIAYTKKNRAFLSFCPSVKKRDKEIMRYMKKSYSAPLCYVVEIALSGVIATSPLEVDDGKQWSEEELDGEATGASRGDWSDIWNGM